MSFTPVKTIINSLFTKNKFKLHNVKILNTNEWKNAEYTKLDVDHAHYVTKPNVFYYDQQSLIFSEGKIHLPPVYLAKLKKVSVIEGTGLILGNRKVALFDEMANDPEGKYGIKIGLTPLIQNRNTNKNTVDLYFCKSKEKLPEIAVHFCKDYSHNFFHWVIESIPRLWVVDQFEEYRNLPLLIDSNLKSSQIELLKLLQQNQRELITLKQGHSYKIRNLIYPSSPSLILNNYNNAITHESGVFISPWAINFVRERILKTLKIVPHPKKKIYISRELSGQTRLLNNEEIKDELIKLGFEVVYPERHSFAEQVSIFSQAKIIVADAGAALTNIIFAPVDCHIFALCTNIRFNPYVFHSLSESIGNRLYHVVGKEAANTMPTRSHNPYILQLPALKAAFDYYLEGKP